ncbi:MAG: CDGSH iron-sulfur domain-containing protein [Betaproteobacteria bacterium]|nr:CDGSH iron-sulfur domain-containing protein [Betaproteobacteria bacterium]
MPQAALCRCGASRNKPFCDGSHTKAGFVDPGLLPASAAPASDAAGRVRVTPLPDGPLKCEGPLTLAATDGRTSTADPTFLCRCGHSGNKPYCDGTHKRIGFTG